MAFWLKLGYFTGARDDPRYWLNEVPWVSDSPGRDSPRWAGRPRPRRGTIYPPFGPRYEVGDRLVMYLTGVALCPAILEVTGQPRWDPARVDREATIGEGNTWDVVTEVRAVYGVPLSQAPNLEVLGLPPRSVLRKGHVRLEDWQYAEAERAIGRGRGRRHRRAPAASGTREERVAVEEGTVEGYEVIRPAEVGRAVRRESRLVTDYARYLTEGGDAVVRNKIRTPQGLLYSDLYNETRKQLVEAKAGTSRNDIRMAIGQLADYRRFIAPRPACAVLLEAKPSPDLLSLLETERIVAVWRQGEVFADNGGGAFT